MDVSYYAPSNAGQFATGFCFVMIQKGVQPISESGECRRAGDRQRDGFFHGPLLLRIFYLYISQILMPYK